MGKILVIFDFDGTIADTRAVYYKSIFGLLKSRGFSNKSIERVIDLGTSLKKALHNLGLGFVSAWFLKRKIMAQVKRHVSEVKKCKDASSIKDIDEEKMLITNSLKEFAVPILRHLNLKTYFNEVYGADDFADKADFISEYLKKNNITKKDCFYIGDRVADVRLAKKVGCISVIISGKCSWNSRSELVRAKPDFLIEDLKDLKEILNKNSHS